MPHSDSKPARSGSSDERRLAIAEAATGHTFADRELLRRALTHPSYDEGAAHDSGYERLEFLGDSIVSLIVTEEVYARFPDLREGDLTRLKIGAVSGPSLAAAAADLGLADAIFLGEGERRTGDRGLASALENVFEALVAALYLDAGFEPARAFVSRALDHHIGEHMAVPAHPKGDLQELVQRTGRTPVYRILAESGPPHERVFTACVEVEGTVLGEGRGRSKKEAEMHAASSALERLAREFADLDQRP